jgi:regulatory protein
MAVEGGREPRKPKSCHERALGLLAVRARSRRELERRLLQASFGSQEVGEVLDRFAAVGLIDDEAFARQVAERAFGIKLAGRRAVASTLAVAGVAADVAARVIDETAGDDDLRAQELASTRAARMGSVEPAKAFSRLTSMLLRRGFSPEVARRAARRALAVDASAGESSLASRFTRP